MQRNYFIVALILLVFFVISFLTNILGPLIPDIIQSFSLSLTLAAFLPFSFFIAYGVMSIPAGMLVERYNEKTVMVAAFGLSFLGALLFALVPVYFIAMISLFLIGVGMAMLQVAINPLLRVAGGEEHFAFNSVLAQLVFGSASFVSPYLYTHLVTQLQNPVANSNYWYIELLARLVPENLPWVSLYWIFALTTLGMTVVLYFVRLPSVERTEDERAGAWETHKKLFKNRTVLLFFLGIFAYVGTEQGIANWISKFLATYHGLSPQVEGARTVSYFWGMMTAGCLLGLVVLKLMDSRHVLMLFSFSAMITLAFALFGSPQTALVAFPLLGFFASVMWSIIFSLALNSLEKHHGSFSGILCTAIIGGAVVPLIIGWLGDHFGLRTGMLFLFLTLSYIFSIGLWANPLIKNETIWMKKENLKLSETIKGN